MHSSVSAQPFQFKTTQHTCERGFDFIVRALEPKSAVECTAIGSVEKLLRICLNQVKSSLITHQPCSDTHQNAFPLEMAGRFSGFSSRPAGRRGGPVQNSIDTFSDPTLAVKCWNYDRDKHTLLSLCGIHTRFRRTMINVSEMIVDF